MDDEPMSFPKRVRGLVAALGIGFLISFFSHVRQFSELAESRDGYAWKCISSSAGYALDLSESQVLLTYGACLFCGLLWFAGTATSHAESTVKPGRQASSGPTSSAPTASGGDGADGDGGD